MNLLQLHHVQITIPKGNEDRARAFYCGVLGLREIPKPESLAGRGGFWLELGDGQVHIGIEDRIDRGRSKAHVAYLVDDLDSWRSRLAAINIEAIDGLPIPGYDRFEFRDPFGNRVELLAEIARR
ncbi:MAG TPA: VOC family protein [Pyrinomonadaceae bacterium]|nr:VOC family protein [Pyrinomonadaceae bacterium]